MEAPKVLIVDDEPALQKALKMALKYEGYQLDFADNGESGLEMFHRINPDLVFLDLKMPVMDGYHFLESLEISPDAPYTIIVITGHGIDQEIEKCYNLGIDFFLKKPLSTVEVCCIARRCIEVKRLKAEREKLIENLQQAQETINYLKAFLVICSSCKRVRDEDEQWLDLDTYLRKHSDTQFSHGVCPQCIEMLYPDILEVIRKKEPKK